MPGVSAFLQLRGLLDRPVKRVGVLYRDRLSSFEKQKRLAAKEKFELGNGQGSRKLDSQDIRKGVKALVDQHKVDTIWVLNDNALLRPNLIMKGWQPAFVRSGVPRGRQY